ncbi:MAG TPA: L-histidine N(alpha)-methyltransferase [Cyclobacteriaceae bacterium]|nr:L-histidine N(alpha)-methyltransferase [Cyclobacteriaceae bacterium]
MVDFMRSFSPFATTEDIFLYDVVTGLSAEQKFLNSKYFYDASGDAIFQQIMKCPEYYLTSCEMEILARQSKDMVHAIGSFRQMFDVVELGPGDASKTTFLLKELAGRGITDTYIPIDISENIVNQLESKLPLIVKGLCVHGRCGDYLSRLKESRLSSVDKRKLVLFMGATIGNFTIQEAKEFCARVKRQLYPGDLFMIGFDLKKDPAVIMDAYNDGGGITKKFNLNLLARINRELDANFDLSAFDHVPTYDLITGACKSFLVSTRDQEVDIGEVAQIKFSKGERIYMEISQKYTIDQINDLATIAGFRPIRNFFDSRGWFVDALWQNG